MRAAVASKLALLPATNVRDAERCVAENVTVIQAMRSGSTAWAWVEVGFSGIKLSLNPPPPGNTAMSITPHVSETPEDDDGAVRLTVCTGLHDAMEVSFLKQLSDTNVKFRAVDIMGEDPVKKHRRHRRTVPELPSKELAMYLRLSLTEKPTDDNVGFVCRGGVCVKVECLVE